MGKYAIANQKACEDYKRMNLAQFGVSIQTWIIDADPQANLLRD